MGFDKEVLKQELMRRRLEKTGCNIVPYKNRDGGISWQTKLLHYVSDSNVQEIIVAASNAVGKTAMGAYFAATFLNGTNEAINKRFGKNHGMKLLYYSPSYVVQKDAIQDQLAQVTDYRISVYSEHDDYKIYKNSGLLKSVMHVKTKNELVFRTSDTGIAGNVGAQPQIIFADEPLPLDVRKELVARNRTANAIFIQVCTTLEIKHAWLLDEARKRLEENDPKYPVLNAAMRDNPFIPEEKLEMFKKVYGEDSRDYRVRVLGELEVLNGVVFDNVDKAIVEDDYEPEGNQNYAWAQAEDYGTYDPTLVIFCKVYPSGEKVIEDELYINQVKDPHEWANQIHKKRDELQMDYYFNSFYNQEVTYDNYLVYDNFGNQVLKGTNVPLRRPTWYVGDGSYLNRSFGGPKLSAIFAQRKLFPTPSKNLKLEVMLPVIQGEIDNGQLKIKRRCKHLINLLERHVIKVNEKTGAIDYNSPYDHGADTLKYLYSILPVKYTMQPFQDEQAEKENMVSHTFHALGNWKRKTKEGLL